MLFRSNSVPVIKITKPVVTKLESKKITPALKIIKPIPVTNTIAKNVANENAQILHILNIKPETVMPKKAKIKSDPYFYFKNGSLHHNVQQFSHKFHYQLIWHVLDPQTGQLADYRFVGNENIVAKTPVEILKQATKDYDLQVNVWDGNHVICVSSDGNCE